MLLLAATLCAGPLFAQPGKGDWIASLNGSFSAAGVKSDSYRFHNLQIKPELLKMLKHNVTLGMVLGIDHTMIWRKDFQPEVDLRTHDLHLQFGPVVRKYFGKGRLVPYAELSAGVDYSMNFSKFSGESGSTYSSADAFIRPCPRVELLDKRQGQFQHFCRYRPPETTLPRTAYQPRYLGKAGEVNLYQSFISC